MQACWRGFDVPVGAPIKLDLSKLKCQGGSNPVKIGGTIRCPKPKDAVCPQGTELKPPPKAPSAGFWADADCVATAQQKQCGAGEQVGLDGKCQKLCPDLTPAPGTTVQQQAWPSTQCCPTGAMVGLDGKCAAPGQMPGQQGGQQGPGQPGGPGQPQQPFACLAGQTVQPGFTCCALGMSLGADGTCKTPCANGDTDPTSVQLCWRGFQPPADPAKFDPSTATCLGGSTPKYYPVWPGKNWSNYKCPKPPLATCAPGDQETPPGNPPYDFWTDADCQQIPAWSKCGPGFLGTDDKCYMACPLGEVGFPGYQCCPAGSTVGPDGKCAAPGQMPGQQGGQPGPQFPAFPPAFPLECPAGQVNMPALKCCPLYMHLDNKGQCQSPCPSGAKDHVSMQACHLGYEQPADPVNFNFTTSPCLGGSPPNVAKLKDGSENITCPAPANAACSFGYKKVPTGLSAWPGPSTWTKATCEPSPEQAKCKPGEQTGFDGQCLQLCPANERAWLSAQCCPQGAILSPEGKCIVPHKLPQTAPPPPSPPKPADPNACAPGYVPTKDNACCLAAQMTPQGTCCPSGTTPRSDGTCEPSPWLPGKQEPSECKEGYVATPSGDCCLASQMTIDGICCREGEKPDSRRQKCVASERVPEEAAPDKAEEESAPAAAACPRGTRRAANGVCCPKGRLTTGGRCCPKGQVASGTRCIDVGIDVEPAPSETKPTKPKPPKPPQQMKPELLPAKPVPVQPAPQFKIIPAQPVPVQPAPQFKLIPAQPVPVQPAPQFKIIPAQPIPPPPKIE